MFSKLIFHHLSISSDDEQYRSVYLNCVCTAILGINAAFFLFYNLVYDYYLPLVFAMSATLLLLSLSQYALFIKRRVCLSSCLLVLVVFGLTHYYMFDVKNLEYALVFGMLTPMVAITLLVRKVALLVVGGQFLVFNYLLLIDMDSWLEIGFEKASYFNLISVWLSVTLLFWYIDSSRIQAVRKVYEAKERLEILATTDSLTGAYNRRFIEKRLNQLPVVKAIAVIDVDNFKLVNDLNGHMVGDSVLQKIAEVLDHLFISVGIVGRWGGEEFIVLITEGDEALAADHLERAKEAVYAYPFALSQPISISVGWSILHNQKVEEAIRHADQALYFAKSNGKNQVVSASSLLTKQQALVLDSANI